MVVATLLVVYDVGSPAEWRLMLALGLEVVVEESAVGWLKVVVT